MQRNARGTHERGCKLPGGCRKLPEECKEARVKCQENAGEYRGMHGNTGECR